MDFEKLFAILLIASILVLSIYIYNSLNKASQTPQSPMPYIPFTSDKKVDCSSVKVPCDPNAENPCGVCDGTEQMKCVSLPDGQNLCLPKEPDISCNAENGGKYVWTGYGFTQSKDWQCLCTRPEIYNGPNCSIRNPSYCSGGKLSSNIDDPLSKICDCGDPKVTKRKLLFRDNNTPMCVSIDTVQGGGEEGLYGNYHTMPDWRNVYFMRADTDINQWAQDISNQFNYGNFAAIETILNKYKSSKKLTQDMVNEISKLSIVFNNSKFDPNYQIVVPYRYFTQTYIP